MQQQGMANILILTDLEKPECITLTQMAIDTLVQHSNFSLYVEDHLKFQNVLLLTAADKGKIQYVISIGSNSTMMKAHRFFDDRSVPVVSVSDGEEPILSSFSSCEMDSIIKKFINGVKERDLSLLETLQFQVSERLKDPKTEPLFKNFHFSFQLEVHRDMSKSVLKLRIYARIEDKSFYHLANVWGDGIIISTPLGSLGRNLSLSGPIVYKSSDSITIVPICPLSLNFRPIILPASAELIISIQEDSRSSGLIFADNQIVSTGLAPGKHIYLRKSSTMTKIVKGLGEKTTEEQWISCLRDVLSWGEAYNSEPKSTSASTPVTKL